jgi:hypothetical protein
MPRALARLIQLITTEISGNDVGLLGSLSFFFTFGSYRGRVPFNGIAN